MPTGIPSNPIQLIVVRTLSSTVSTSHQILAGVSAYAMTVDDELFREQKEAITIDFATLQRTEGMAGRALKSKWYFLLTGWVDVINGGLGKISRTGKLDSRVKSKMGSKTEIIHEVKNEEPNEELNGELNGEPNGELNGQQNGGPDEGSEGQ